MTQTIKIKRSTGNAAPSTLASGELAYSKGIDTFYIGDPAAVNTPIAIGPAIKNNAGTPELSSGITAAEIRSLLDVDQGGTATQNLWATINSDSGSATANSVADILNIVGGTDIETSMSGDTLTINFTGTGSQSLWSTITSDSGSATANTSNDILNILGGNAIATSMSADTLTIAYDGPVPAITSDGASPSLAAGITAAEIRTLISVDQAGTDNSTNVTLTGTPDYISISAQKITVSQVDLAADVTGSLPNSNLANSSVTIGSTSISLGGSATSISGITALKVDNVQIGVGGTNEINTASGGLTLDSAAGTTTVDDNLTVTGNLTVQGVTTTISSTTLAVTDPIITLGGSVSPSDDNKDRGIEFSWHNGTTAKTGFFGFDDSAGKFTFIPDATNSSEVFSGTAGTIVASLEGNASTASTLAIARNFSLTGDVSAPNVSFNGSGAVSLTTTIQAGAVDFSMLSGASYLTSGETFANSDSSLMTAAAIAAKIESYGYTGNTGDITGITISSSDASIAGGGVATSGSPVFNLTVATIDGGVY